MILKDAKKRLFKLLRENINDAEMLSITFMLTYLKTYIFLIRFEYLILNDWNT